MGQACGLEEGREAVPPRLRGHRLRGGLVAVLRVLGQLVFEVAGQNLVACRFGVELGRLDELQKQVGHAPARAAAELA
jgi:hypothetical protein